MKSNYRRHSKGNLLPVIVTGLALIGTFCQAQVVNLSHNNSVASIDLSNPNPALAGMFNWSVQGQNQLRQQWFWYRVGGGPEQTINSISAPVVTPFLGTRGVTATYANASYSVEVDYLLTGGSIVPPGGLGQSDIQETISIHNTSAAPLDFHFFQYSDFDLAGLGNDSVVLGTDPFGRFNSANQSDGISLLTESVSVAAPSASHGEANFFNATWTKLNNGGPDVLNDTASAGPGNVTWALQWDMVLLPNDTFIISKDKHLQVQIIPEPGMLGLLGLGTIVYAFRRRASAQA